MTYTTFIDGTNYELRTAIPKKEFDELVNKANNLASQYIVPLSDTLVYNERSIKSNITVEVYNHKRSIDGLHDVIELLENKEIQELLIDVKDLLNHKQPKHKWCREQQDIHLIFNTRGFLQTPKLIRKYYTVLYNSLNRLYTSKKQNSVWDYDNPLLPIQKRETYYFTKEEKAYLKDKESEE